MISFALPFYKKQWFSKKSDLMISVLSGILLGLHFFTWIASLSMTSISSSVVLVTTQPIFVAILGFMVLRERIGIIGIIAVVLAMIGSYLVASGDLRIDSIHLKGDILAILGAVFAGSYLFIGRFVRRRVDLIPYVMVVYSVSAIVLLILGLLFSNFRLPSNNNDYWFFFLMALGPTILGHNLYNYALRHLPAFPVGMSILGEPILASIWAMLIFSEMPTLSTIFGGIIIILAITMTIIKMKMTLESKV